MCRCLYMCLWAGSPRMWVVEVQKKKEGRKGHPKLDMQDCPIFQLNLGKMNKGTDYIRKYPVIFKTLRT